MKIGELFVELAAKGSEKMKGALKEARSGMNELASSSLATKAAIAGVLYGMQRLMSESGQMGTALTNFTHLTGLSAKNLQQWQYAARQAGVSSEEFTGNLKSVQQAMTNMLMGKGAPEGMGLLANQVGFDPKRARDTFYVMEQLQKFARSGVPEDLANSVIKSFGVSEGTIAAMRRNMFRPEVFSRAPTYSENEIKKLDQVNVAWSNLGQKIQMAFGQFTAKHGMQLVSDISKVADSVLKLTNALGTLADKLKIFQIIGKAFEGWGLIFEGITSTINDAQGGKYNSMGGPVAGFLSSALGGAKDAAYGAYLTASDAMMTKPTTAQKTTNNNQNVTVNQNLNFQHDGKDAQKTSGSVREAVQKAYRQNSALKGGY